MHFKALYGQIFEALIRGKDRTCILSLFWLVLLHFMRTLTCDFVKNTSPAAMCLEESNDDRE